MGKIPTQRHRLVDESELAMRAWARCWGSPRVRREVAETGEVQASKVVGRGIGTGRGMDAGSGRECGFEDRSELRRRMREVGKTRLWRRAIRERRRAPRRIVSDGDRAIEVAIDMAYDRDTPHQLCQFRLLRFTRCVNTSAT